MKTLHISHTLKRVQKTACLLLMCTGMCALSAGARVVINELHYNPPGPDDLTEFIELWNISDVPVDMSGWTFSDGVDFTFPDGAILGPGEMCVVARYPAIFSAVHPDVSPVYGPFENGTRLANSGERVALSDVYGAVVSEVTYRDKWPWPREPDGDGPTLELINPLLDTRDPASWRTSHGNEGTPGATNSVFLPEAVAFTTERHPPAPAPGMPANMRLSFTMGVPTSVYVYALINDMPYAIACAPAGGNAWTSQIPAQVEGTWVFYDVAVVSSNGIRYTHPQGMQSYVVREAPLMPGEIVINEIMHTSAEEAADRSYQFVEFYNAGTRTVNLERCFFDGHLISLTPLMMPPDSYLVIADRPQVMSNVYGAVPNMYRIALDLKSEDELILYSPNGIVLDSVAYEDTAPWPQIVDGFGPSLERVSPYAPSYAAENWAPSEGFGTPGRPNSTRHIADTWRIEGIRTSPHPVTGADTPFLTAHIYAHEMPSQIFLEYTTNRLATTMVEMFDDGAHGDGWASNGCYGTALPAFPDGTFVWYAFHLVWDTGDSVRYPAREYEDAPTPDITFRLAHSGLWTDVTPKPYWQTVTNVGAATSSRMYIYTDAAGEVLIDDVSITYNGAEHVINGAFTDNLNGWTRRGTHANSLWTGAYGNNAPGCLHIRADGPGSSVQNSVSQDTSPSLVTDGREYTMTFAYRSMPGTMHEDWLFYRVGATFPTTIRISEINYNTMHDALGNMDFIELYNYGDVAVDITEWTLENRRAVRFHFPPGSVIQPGNYLLACVDAAQCGEYYGIPEKCVGDLPFDPSNRRDTFILRTHEGELIDIIQYYDTPPWPVRADGDGGTLERRNIHADGRAATNWFVGPSCGTPGTGYDQTFITHILHDPPVPLSTEALQITAWVTNDLPDTVVRLYYRQNDTSPWIEREMTRVTEGIYHHTLGTFANGTRLRFYCEASNSVVRTRFPVWGPALPAMCEVDNRRDTFTLPVFRFLFTDHNWNTLHNRRYWDNTDVDATLIIGTQIFYNVGIHLAGNFSRSAQQAFNAYLNYDQTYHGHRKVPYRYNWEHSSRLALPFAQMAYRHMAIPVYDSHQISVIVQGVHRQLMHYVEPYDPPFMDKIGVVGNMYKAAQTSLQQAHFTFGGYGDIYEDCYENHADRDPEVLYDDLARGLEALYILPPDVFHERITNYFDAHNFGLEHAMYHYLKIGDSWPQWGQNYVLMTEGDKPIKIIPQDIGAVGWGPWEMFPTVAGVRRISRHPVVVDAFWRAFTNLYYSSMSLARMHGMIEDLYAESRHDVDYRFGNTTTFNSQKNDLKNIMSNWRNASGDTQPSGIINWGLRWISSPNRSVLLGDDYYYHAHAWHPGVASIQYSKVVGPDWLHVDTVTGVVTGTPPAEGTFTLWLRATNGSETRDQSFTVAVQKPSQRLWLRLNEGSGTTAFDSSGQGNHGVLQNNVQWSSEGRYGNSLLFGPGSLDRVYVAPHSSMNIQGDFTFEAWIRFTQNNKPKAQIFHKFEELGFEQGVSYSFDGGRMWYGPFDDGKARRPGLNGHGYIVNRYNRDASERLMAPHVWHHVAVTHERFRNEVYVYVNGQRIAGMEWNDNLLGTTELILGGPFDGWIDEAKLFSFAREAFNIGVSIEAVRFERPNPYVELRYFDGGAHPYVELKNYALYLEPSGTWVPLPDERLRAGEARRIYIDDAPGLAALGDTGGVALYPYEPNTVYPPSNYRHVCTRILDYVAYGNATAAPGENHPAVQAGIWDAGTYVSTASNTHGRVVLRTPGRNDERASSWKSDVRLRAPTLHPVPSPSPSYVTFSWSAPLLAETYQAQWSPDASFAAPQTVTTSATSFATLLEQDTWYWRVRAMGNGQTSIFTYSSPFTVSGDYVNVLLDMPSSLGTFTNATQVPISFSVFPDEIPETTAIYAGSTQIGNEAGVYTLAEGTHPIWVRVTLTNGLTAVSTTNMYIIDMTPPTMALLHPADGTLTNTRQTLFVWHATDAHGIARGELSTNSGATWLTHEYGQAVLVEDGTYMWTARAWDHAGNVSAVPAARQLTIDATAPFVTTNTLITPHGGEEYLIGEELLVTWRTNHFYDAHPHPYPIALWLGTNGHMFYPLAEGLPVDTNYVWEIPENIALSEMYTLWLEARDSLGNVAYATNETVFAIIPEVAFGSILLIMGGSFLFFHRRR